MTSREWLNLEPQSRGLIEEHQAEVPVKISDIASSLGIVVKAATLPAGISGEIRPDPEQPDHFIVRVNRHDPKRRQRFTVAHEIAHFLLHRGMIGAGIRDDVLYRSNVPNTVEAQANRLAADILIPQSLLNRWLDTARALKVEDVPAYLANRFEVSEASMRIKLGLD